QPPLMAHAAGADAVEADPPGLRWAPRLLEHGVADRESVAGEGDRPAEAGVLAQGGDARGAAVAHLEQLHSPGDRPREVLPTAREGGEARPGERDRRADLLAGMAPLDAAHFAPFAVRLPTVDVDGAGQPLVGIGCRRADHQEIAGQHNGGAEALVRA